MDSKESRLRRRKGRRARGTGSIFFNDAKQRWVGRAVVGRSPTGKTLYVERWGKTQAEVVAKLAAAKAPGPDTTVSAWAARWLAGISVRPSTRDNYEHTVTAYINPALGHLRVADVTPLHIEHAAKGWAADVG